MSFPQTRRFWAQLGAADGGDPGDGPQDDATQPQRLFAKSEFFGRPLPSEAIAALVATFSEGRAAGQYRELDFMPWGGAYNRVPPEATAFVHRAELFQLKHAAVVDTPGVPGGGKRRRPPVGHPLLGVRAPVGIRARVPKLRRPGPRQLGRRVLRHELRAPRARQGAL
ncbi:MAG TPA: hypothetical protein VE623_01955 [Acidimicrobiales bacterium]|nr:hypothetical protein [Acidimicrobiales bacterium]